MAFTTNRVGGASDGTESAAHDTITGPTAPQVSPDLQVLAAAQRAVNLIVHALSTARIGVAKRIGDTTNERFDWQPKHPLNTLLQEPCSLLPAYRFWEMVLRQYVAQGNGYAQIKRNLLQQPMDLIPVTCTGSWWEQRAVGPRRFHLAVPLGAATPHTLNDAHLLGIHGDDYDGLRASSPIARAGKVGLETIRGATQHNLSTLWQGLHARLALEAEPVTIAAIAGSEKKARDLEQRVKSEWSGATKAGATPIVPIGFKISQLSDFTASDHKLVEVLNWSIADVARAFDVPPWMLLREEPPARISQWGEYFARYTLAHHTRNLESTLSRALLSDADRRAGYVVHVDASAHERGSLKERVETAYNLVTKSGLGTINQGLAVIGLPPTKDGDRRIENPAGAPKQTDHGGRTADEPGVDGPRSVNGNGRSTHATTAIP